MNSLDLYDFTVSANPSESPPPENAEVSSSSAAAPEDKPSQPTLNEEVTQVIGHLGRFWGGVRKQSQNVFEVARKDLGGVVTQAQKELEKFSQRPAASTESPAQVSEDKHTEGNPADPDSAPEGLNAGPTLGPTPPDVPTSSNFLTRLQGSLPQSLTPTALSITLQRHLPENLQHGLNLENASADFNQLRATLATNIQRVQQGTTVQQAEKLAEQYMHKGEALFREAGEFFKDAVKVVPPEESEDVPGVVWDGTDFWTMPTPDETYIRREGSRKGKDKESNVIFSMPRAAAKRADILLKKLRGDPELIRQDPDLDEDESVKELWRKFIEDQVDVHGGMNEEVWVKRIGTALEGHDKDEDAKALAALRDLLVPAELAYDKFWTRYFFRVYQIEREEVRRKALLADANHDEEDFSWEDEDEGEDDDNSLSLSQTTKTLVNASSSSTLNPSPKPSLESTDMATLPVQNLTSSTSQGTSPRESEDSYDVVSSGNVSSAGGKIGERTPKLSDKDAKNGDDSDWE